jgi:hypothetical protein
MSQIRTPGIGDCPDCGRRVLFALAATGDLIPLDEGPGGPVVVAWDRTRTPRVRPVGPSGGIREGEHRFGLHVSTCRVLFLDTARIRRRPENARRYA